MGGICSLSSAENSPSLVILSNAFDQSNSTSIAWFCVPSVCSNMFLMMCIASAVLLFLRNPYCAFCRCLSRCFAILFCNMAANSL